MKNRLLTGIATLLLFLPWTILPLRTLPWALTSPAASSSSRILFAIWKGKC